MLIRGPGIKAGVTLDYLGTNVDLAPTMLGLAGLDTPASMDGRSIVPLIVTETNATTPPNNGNAAGGGGGGGGVDENENLDTVAAVPASVLRHLERAEVPPHRKASFHIYYNQGPWEVSQRHPLDDWSNTYRGLAVRDKGGLGNWKYGEYAPYGKQSDFNVSSIELYELFDLDKDPYELNNVWATANASLKAELKAMTAKWYGCTGSECG